MKGVEDDSEEIGELLSERLKLVPSSGVVVSETLLVDPGWCARDSIDMTLPWTKESTTPLCCFVPTFPCLVLPILTFASPTPAALVFSQA